MRKPIRFIFFYQFIITAFFLNSCNNLIPNAFWKNFESEYIVENISDQGPYGGHLAMHWKTKYNKTFNAEKIIAFAKENGWTFTGKENFNPKSMKDWKKNGKLIFPLTSQGFKPTFLDDNISKHFPRWINSNNIVYKFKTNFVTLEPGTDNSIEENGFIIINKEANEMSVYNLWGE
ncbi:hypothetical protein [Flavobacterium anhuiense]|uniref:hypothetical protein n=1 Tax=Flavobacterium anhuiense TaxID=459526 RepID=UPI003D97B77F